MRDQLLDKLKMLVEIGETLDQEVGAYLNNLDRMPRVEVWNVDSFLARCAIDDAEAAALSMTKKLLNVYGDRLTDERALTPHSRSPFLVPPPDVEHVAGRMSKGNKSEVYTGLILRSPDTTKTYHALRTFGEGEGEQSICGMVKKGERTREAPIRDLEVLECDPCKRCFSDQVIPLSLREQMVQAKSRVTAWSREYVRIQEQVKETDNE